MIDYESLYQDPLLKIVISYIDFTLHWLKSVCGFGSIVLKGTVQYSLILHFRSFP